MKFLLVDDDPVVRDLLTEILIGIGYEDIQMARNGGHALQILKAQPEAYDCLLVDIRMDGMDGIELCRAVRQLPKYSRVPIIMITAERSDPYVTRAFAVGATDYIVKPFDVAELVERVRLAEIIKDPAQARELVRTRQGRGDGSENADSLISLAALRGYARNCRKHRIMSPAAAVVHVAMVQGHGLGQVAELLARVLPGKRVFSSYLGAGDFLVLCDEKGLQDDADLSEVISSGLANASYGDNSRKPPHVEVGGWSRPRPLEGTGNIAFLARAITEKKTKDTGHFGNKRRAFFRRLVQRA